MEEEHYGVFCFSSTQQAISAEPAVLQKDGTPLIPVTPAKSAGCGLSQRTQETGIKTVAGILAAEHIPYEGLYRLTIKDKQRTIGKIEDDLL